MGFLPKAVESEVVRKEPAYHISDVAEFRKQLPNRLLCIKTTRLVQNVAAKCRMQTGCQMGVAQNTASMWFTNISDDKAKPDARLSVGRDLTQEIVQRDVNGLFCRSWMEPHEFTVADVASKAGGCRSRSSMDERG